MDNDNTTEPCKRHDCKRVRAEMQAVVERVQAERDTALAECNEQARLNGMGAEREARLMAQVAELRAERDALANTDAGSALALLSRMRWACGDNGLRMQDELEDYLRGLAQDAARIDWIGAHVKAVILYGDTAPRLLWADTELPRYPRDVRSGIDAAIAEGER